MRFKINKNARFNTSLLAGAGFIGLAVWGLGLPLKSVMVFFAICVASLLVIVALAAAVGFALSRLRRNGSGED